MIESKKEEEKKESWLICTYGTLRLNQGNWRHRLANKSEHLGTFDTEPKFTLYGRGAGFPVLSPKGDTSVKYDLFKITDKSVLRGVYALEGYSGVRDDDSNWYDTMEIETPHGTAEIFIMKDITRSEESVITSGDWLNQN